MENQNVLQVREERISLDKTSKYKGSVRVQIAHLDFPHSIREVDEKVIEQLKKDFEGEGCLRSDSNNRIPATIDESMLRTSLQKLGMDSADLRRRSQDPPHLRLEPGVKLECLHGKHRVHAARQYLDASQRWWMVDLYGTDLNVETRQAFREGYSYSASYRSGEIFRQLRLCHFDNDEFGVQRWKARLSPPLNKFLDLLSKRRSLIGALDSALHIRGLWRTFYLGSLDIMFTLRCDEEIAHYVGEIKKTWNHIFDNDVAMMMESSPSTIEALRSRVPALCRLDFIFVQEGMRSGGELLPEVTDQRKRDDILQRLLARDEMIPTFYTLIKDLRYLKQSASIMSALVPKSPRKTLRQRFHFHFAPPSEQRVEIQQATTTYSVIEESHQDVFDIAYQQLWLCAYRIWNYAETYGLFQISMLAHRLGFISADIDRRRSRDPARDLLENTIREVFYILRPNEGFNLDAEQARPLIASFDAYLKSISGADPTKTSPQITVSGPGEPVSRRSGHSCMDTNDLDHLFLDKLHTPLHEFERAGEGVSSFYVKRARHIAFFGALKLSNIQTPPNLGVSHDPTSSREPAPVTSPTSERPTASTVALENTPISISNVQTAGGSLGFPTSAQNEPTIPMARVVTFVENQVPTKHVLWGRDEVNSQAQEYADQGKKLHVAGGPYFVWQHCFDILEKTGNSNVIVSTVLEPRHGKRRRGQELPDRFQLATKEAFDFNMEEEEEEEEEEL